MDDADFIFKVVSRTQSISGGPFRAYLREDSWDDWFKYSTLFDLIVYDEKGNRHDIGGVKIGQFEMAEDQRRPNIESPFSQLDERFFSLGQSEEYYEHLRDLSAKLRKLVVRGLRDVVADPEIWERAKNTNVTEVSLTRSVSRKSIKGQFKRLLNGGTRLTDYDFSFAPPPSREISSKAAPALEFCVRPESNPPTNVHVLIGRNGVGKTRMLDKMTRALVGAKRSAAQSGRFSWNEEGEDSDSPFSNVVTVSFSAFDETELLPEQTSSTADLRYYYIGLRRNVGAKPSHGKPKSPKLLAKEFVNSVMECVHGPRRARWRRALQMLEADRIFKEAEVVELARLGSRKEVKDRSEWVFKHLSSGHKIVLLTITRLVEVVEEKSLVLIDEPEAHLHPPLLSAFVRSLSDLLVNRNGVAIIATHSPVILQEVPRTCVWLLQRSGADANVERPACETFGENVGVLTREVFGLEVVQTGFHRLLTEAVEKGQSFDTIIERFNEELGAEARAILRALISTRQTNEDE